MNYRLDAMCERVWLFKDMRGDYAAEKLDETRQRISDFARSARQHNFIFHDMNGKGRAAHVGPEQPRAMNLISLAVDKKHARARADLPAAAERDRPLRCPWPGTNAGTSVRRTRIVLAKRWQPSTSTLKDSRWNWSSGP